MLSPWILLPALLLVPLLYWFLKTPSIALIPTATPHIPLIGNSVSFGIDPVKFLLNQRAKHGDIFLVDLAVIRVVFFLGPEGTNAVLKGTEKGGISLWTALSFLIGSSVEKGPL
jgi:sterol 14-demethylase